MIYKHLTTEAEKADENCDKTTYISLLHVSEKGGCKRVVWRLNSPRLEASNASNSAFKHFEFRLQVKIGLGSRLFLVGCGSKKIEYYGEYGEGDKIMP